MDYPTESQQRDLDEAQAKILKILQHHDLVGFVALTNRAGSKYAHQLETTWGHITQTDDKISIRVADDDIAAKKAKLQEVVKVIGGHLHTLSHGQKMILGTWVEIGLLLNPNFMEEVMSKFGEEPSNDD